MANKNLKALNRMMSDNDAEKAVGKADLRQATLDALGTGTLKNTVLANLRSSAPSLNMMDLFGDISNAIYNLRVGKTDVEKVEIDKKIRILFAEVNNVINQAIQDNALDLVSGTTNPAEKLAARKFFLKSRIQNKMLENPGTPISDDVLAGILEAFLNDNAVFDVPGTREADFNDMFGIVTIIPLTPPLPPANRADFLAFVQGNAEFARIKNNARNSLSAVGGDFEAILGLKPDLDSILQKLTDNFQLKSYEELLDLLLNDPMPVFLRINDPVIQDEIKDLRANLGANKDNRIENLALILSVTIYEGDTSKTRADIHENLKVYFESLTQPEKTSFVDKKIKDAINNLDVASVPEFNRLLTNLIKELEESEYALDAKPLETANKLLHYAGVGNDSPANDQELKRSIRDRIYAYVSDPSRDLYNKRVSTIAALVPLSNEIRTSVIPVPALVTQDDYDRHAELILSNLMAIDSNLPHIAEALSLPVDSDEDTMTKTISNLLQALNSKIRFDEHPRKKLSIGEIERAVVPHLGVCSKVLEELGVPRTDLKDAIKSPNTNRDLYLKFKKIAGKHGQISDVDMLQHIVFLEAVEKDGHNFDLDSIANKGFVNGLNRNNIASNIPNFEANLRGYTNVHDYLKGRAEFLSTIAEAQKSVAQKAEYALLMKISNPNELHVLIREIAENYKIPSQMSADAKGLYDILIVKYNPSSPASPNFLAANPGSSALIEMLTNSYKAIYTFDTVHVPRISEVATDPDGNPIPSAFANEMLNVNNARGKYAKDRRSLANFSIPFIRNRKRSEGKMEDSRNDYVDASKKFILGTIKHEFPDSDISNDPEKKKNRKLEMGNRILEMMNNERRDLFQEEIDVHGRSMWTKFRSRWRKQWKIPRMIGGAALIGAGIFIPGAGLVSMVGLATLRVVGAMEGTSSVWEMVRNRFGKTKKMERSKVNALDADAVHDSLAAHSTLAISEKYDIQHGAFNVPDMNAKPESIREFTSREAASVSAVYDPDSQRNEPDNYRQTTAQELWRKNNENMRSIIDKEIDAGSNIETILAKVFEAEKALMIKIETREHEIRKNNRLKRWTALAAGVLVGGLGYWLTKPETVEPTTPTTPTTVVHPPTPPPIPPTLPPVTTTPITGGGSFKISEDLFGAYSDTPGLYKDPSPGILANLMERLSEPHGSSIIETPEIKRMILDANPKLHGNWNFVKTGWDINVPPDLAAEIATRLNSDPTNYRSGWTAQKVIDAVNRP